MKLLIYINITNGLRDVNDFRFHLINFICRTTIMCFIKILEQKCLSAKENVTSKVTKMEHHVVYRLG